MVVKTALIFGALLLLISGTSGDHLSSRDFADAFDAALVRVQRSKYQDIVVANAPFRSVASFTCSPSPEFFPFPSESSATGILARVLRDRVIRVAAIGPSDFGIDGDYTVDPPVGFWPDYLEAILDEFQVAYGNDITLSRTFWPVDQTDDLLAAVADGDLDMTEPYFVVGGFFEGRTRQESLHMSCTSMGYDSTFFTSRDSGIQDVEQLYVAINSGDNKKVGFLGQGNYDSVAFILPTGVEPIFYTETDDVEADVASGELIAGLFSGLPAQTEPFNLFSSTVVSPRASFFRPECSSSSIAALPNTPLLILSFFLTWVLTTSHVW
eukprot:CAMPEP_0119126680 /NCGR_PEP_ID=MMETSP1310-20130426/5511_1 /TAXON_ID=464262 /ORGANISM="Genus nov. species nov., Strain RCC2339" /LENGTH=323 /DNA_ID=CAMNT_0007116851 /DNA_START=141 /DNA_END=1109 /DNA_ORIENTATION=-